MWSATILLIFAVPQTGGVTKTETDPQAAIMTAATEAPVSAERLPSMPAPKAASDGPVVSDATGSASASSSASAPAVESVSAGSSSFRLEPAKPALAASRETPGQRKMWYTLLVTSHGAAGFDAWSTRRAVARGYTEGNPLLRPFANSNAIYVATQVSPAVMDYLGKRMMVSQHTWIRRMWWLPQVAGSGFSIGAGVHNVGIVH